MLNAADLLQEFPTDSSALEHFIPIIYQQLRKVAANKLNGDAGRDLQATELVHEALLKIFAGNTLQWNDRQHFFAVAAEVMRRILVDLTRKQQSLKRGGGLVPEELHESSLAIAPPPEEILAVDEALALLEKDDPQAAELVKLRYFVGLTMDETASALGISKRSAESIWTYARTWLHREIRKSL
jgi:RNA polymerase sigma factor (TIGR02999 family)